VRRVDVIIDVSLVPAFCRRLNGGVMAYVPGRSQEVFD
jgi:hypothetical protein